MDTYNRPNIIIVISDALRPKDLSLYGRTIELDKNIKKIASESVVCNLNFSASNGSDPSVTSLFSGQYPMTTGFIHQHPFMRKEEIDRLKKNKFWLPTYLKNKGYYTFSATPLHLWFKKGFDYYTEKDDLKSGRFLDIPIIKRFLLALPNWAYKFGKKITKARASPQFYSSDRVIDFTMKKIMGVKDKPFFCFMHLVDTHYPYPIAQINKIEGKKTLNKILEKIETTKQKEYIKKRFLDISAENLEQIERKRDDSIKEVDKNLGKLHSFLKKSKLWDNTIFVFLSDHGDNFGEHGIYFCRGGLYDSSVHVPLIIHLPKISTKVINELTQTIDIAPTILEVLNEKNKNLDGKSILKIIRNNKKIREKTLFIDSFCDYRIGIRTKDRKAILTRNGRCYLCGANHNNDEKEEYDLKKDPEELEDIHSENSELNKLIPKVSKTNI